LTSNQAIPWPKNTEIKQNQAKSEQGFDLGHKDTTIAKKSRIQAKDEDKEWDKRVKDKEDNTIDYDKIQYDSRYKDKKHHRL
jgi:hypothetical protein